MGIELIGTGPAIFLSLDIIGDIIPWRPILDRLLAEMITATLYFSEISNANELAALKFLGFNIGLAGGPIKAEEYIETRGAEAFIADEIEIRLQAFKKAGLGRPVHYSYPESGRGPKSDRILRRYFRTVRAVGIRYYEKGSLDRIDVFEAVDLGRRSGRINSFIASALKNDRALFVVLRDPHRSKELESFVNSAIGQKAGFHTMGDLR